MSALPWVPLYVNDFLSDVGHLGNTELGVYTRLLLVYYRDAKPLPFDADRLRRLAMTFSPEEFRALESVMSEFFRLSTEPDGRQVWRHTRADKIIAEATAKHATASAKAVAAAAARWAKNAPSIATSDAPSIASGNAYAMPTTTTTTTTTISPSLRAGEESAAVAPPPAAPEQAPKKRGRKPASGAKPSRRCPADYIVTEEMALWAQRETPLVTNIMRQLGEFRDHEFKPPGHTDWDAAFRNWLRRAQKWEEERRQPASGQRQQQYPHKNAGVAGALFLDHVKFTLD